MAPPIFWFNQGPMENIFQPGKIVQFSHPQQIRWMIEKIIRDYDHQMDEGKADAPSYAAIRRLCHDADNPTTSYTMMRAYIQVPHTNTELEDSKTRAAQAIKFRESLETHHSGLKAPPVY